MSDWIKCDRCIEGLMPDVPDNNVGEREGQ